MNNKIIVVSAICLVFFSGVGYGITRPKQSVAVEIESVADSITTKSAIALYDADNTYECYLDDEPCAGVPDAVRKSKCCYSAEVDESAHTISFRRN